MEVTARMAKRMQEMRAAGKKRHEIAQEFGVSLNTVDRHVNPKMHEKMKAWERDRYRRIKADPDKWAMQLERNKVKSRNYRLTSKGND